MRTIASYIALAFLMAGSTAGQEAKTVPLENVIPSRFLDVFSSRPKSIASQFDCLQTRFPQVDTTPTDLPKQPDRKYHPSPQQRRPTPDFSISQSGDREPIPTPDTPVLPDNGEMADDDWNEAITDGELALMSGQIVTGDGSVQAVTREES